MATSKSQITALPTRFDGLRVLLVESDQSSLKHHAHMLSKNSYRVTSSRKAESGLSMIKNGSIFDYVVVDVEKYCEMDTVHFLQQISKHQPNLLKIVMAWNEFQVRLVKDALANEAVWFLRQPCEVSQLCSVLQHLFSKRIQFGEGTSTRKPLEEKQGRNTTVINNSLLSRNGTHRGLNIKSRVYGDMSKPVNYIDLSKSVKYIYISSDDDEKSIKDTNGNRNAKNIDKGKKSMELKRKNDQRVEDAIYRKNKLEIKTETPGATALNGKLIETSNALPKKNTYRKEIPILKQLNLSGVTRDHVASDHVTSQIFQESKNNIIKPKLEAPIQKGNNLQVPNFSCKILGLLNPSDNDVAITHCNNSAGVAFMTIENVKARLQEALLLPSSQHINALLNYSSGGQANGHNFGALSQPLIGASEESNINFVEDVNNFLNSFANGNYGGSGVSETLAPVDRFGIKVEPLVTTSASVATSTNQVRLENLTFDEFPSFDLEGFGPLHDFEGNVENLFDVEESKNLIFSNSDSVSFGHISDDFSFPSIPSEENNSIVPYDGSEGRVIDDDWFLGMIHPE